MLLLQPLGSAAVLGANSRPSALRFSQRQELGALRARYDRLATGSAAVAGLPDVSVRALVAGIADLEYAIDQREALKRALSRWTVLHVAAAIALYPLLALHIWNGVYYGLRWLR